MNTCEALVSAPPPLSFSATVTVADPFAFGAGVYESFPLASIAGCAENNPFLSFETANETVCETSLAGPAEIAVAQAAVCGPASSNTV